MPAIKTSQILVEQLEKAGRSNGFEVQHFGSIEGCPLLALRRSPAKVESDARHIYLSAGIHGDEPAGPQALLELLESKALPSKHHYTICPLLNPSGLARGRRENNDGRDLNRDYREPQSVEIEKHIAWIQSEIKQLDCSLLLHEDWESKGFYLYELNLSEQASRADSILSATRPFLPTESAEMIDGRSARAGVIRPETLPDIEEGDPEAIFLYKCFGGINYTLETPSAADLRRRIDCHKAAVLAAL